jgi:hypothetical protein
MNIHVCVQACVLPWTEIWDDVWSFLESRYHIFAVFFFESSDLDTRYTVFFILRVCAHSGMSSAFDWDLYIILMGKDSGNHLARQITDRHPQQNPEPRQRSDQQNNQIYLNFDICWAYSCGWGRVKAYATRFVPRNYLHPVMSWISWGCGPEICLSWSETEAVSRLEHVYSLHRRCLLNLSHQKQVAELFSA